MLLIFFLVTSSMDSDWGLQRQLSQPENPTEQQEDFIVKQRNALCLQLDAHGALTCNGEPLPVDSLAQRVELFVDNASAAADLPEKSEREVNLLGRCLVSDRHVIIVDVHPQASYSAYFDMQQAIVTGYSRLRDRLALSRFGRSYAQCDVEQRQALAMVYPQRISERTAGEEGGEP